MNYTLCCQANDLLAFRLFVCFLLLLLFLKTFSPFSNPSSHFQYAYYYCYYYFAALQSVGYFYRSQGSKIIVTR